MGMRKEEEYSEEDLERIRKVTTSSIHSVKRKPFRPWRLLFAWWAVVSLLGLVAFMLAHFKGVV